MGLFSKPKPTGKHVSKEYWTQDKIIARQEKGDPAPSRHDGSSQARHRSRDRIWSDPPWMDKR